MTNNALFRPLLPLAIALICGCNGSEDSPGGDSRGSADDSKYSVTGQLNDTGILQCAAPGANQQACPQSELPGQDAETGRDVLAAKGSLTKQGAGIGGFDFTKLDAAGNVMPVQDQQWNDEGNEEEGTRWSCVRDNVTGLMWEIKESDPEHPRYAGHVYRWWLDGEEFNGGFPDYNSTGPLHLWQLRYPDLPQLDQPERPVRLHRLAHTLGGGAVVHRRAVQRDARRGYPVLPRYQQHPGALLYQPVTGQGPVAGLVRLFQ